MNCKAKFCAIVPVDNQQQTSLSEELCPAMEKQDNTSILLGSQFRAVI